MQAGRSLSVVLAGGFLLVSGGCTKTGLAWVHEPESGVDLSPPADARPESPQSARSGARQANENLALTADVEDAQPARRLDHTITLGETVGASGMTDDVATRQGGQAPVVINIYNYVGAPQPVYAPSYGYGVGYPVVGARSIGARAVTVQPGSTGTIRPGMDWAPPPSYGPAFPYRMGPSSPWAGDGSDRGRGR
jgi:hypothetical protein